MTYERCEKRTMLRSVNGGRQRKNKRNTLLQKHDSQLTSKSKNFFHSRLLYETQAAPSQYGVGQSGVSALFEATVSTPIHFPIYFVWCGCATLQHIFKAFSFTGRKLQVKLSVFFAITGGLTCPTHRGKCIHMHDITFLFIQSVKQPQFELSSYR